jgi:probable rRNA maturation factor
VPILFHTLDVPFNLKHKKEKKKWLKEVIEHHNKRVGEINFIFCSEEQILQINQSYLKHNYLTDIITFPFTTDILISADIYICTPEVKRNSEIFDQTFSRELNRVMVHGVLHLLGYNDHNQEEIEEMRKQEDFWIKQYEMKQDNAEKI